MRPSRHHTQKTANHGRIVDTVSISERPATAEDRAVSAQIVIRPRYKLADLLAEMPSGLPRAGGWDEMQYVGLERF
jgi:hypothetical protein